MAGHLPTLDKEALLKLRAMVKRMQAENGTGVQLPQLLELANGVTPGTGLTVDFDASEELGQPLVVIRTGIEQALPAWAEKLSPREREVVALLAQGLPNKLIARQLSISPATVKDHVHRILDKSGLRNRASVTAQWPVSSASEPSKPQ